MFKVIESKRFDHLPHACRKQTFRDDEHHPGRASPGRYFVYYDAWSCRRIDEHSAKSHVSTKFR